MTKRPPPGEAARSAIEAARREVDAAESSLSSQLFSAFLAWFMRWSVWFAVIWAITAYTERYEWLWALGAVLAALFLVVALGSRVYLHRAAARKRESLDALDAQMREEERRNDD